MVILKRSTIQLFWLVALENAAVLLTRYTRSEAKSNEVFEISQFMIATECGKLVLATILEVVHTNGNIGVSLWQHNLATKEGILMMGPATLYFIQNNLFYVALSHLPAPVFQVTYQIKLLMAAFVSMMLLKRKYSTKQWICLVLLTVGIAAASSSSEEEESNVNATLSKVKKSSGCYVCGLFAVFLAAVCSALAGVLFEKYLKSASRSSSSTISTSSISGTVVAPYYLLKPSLYMRNIQLSSVSVAFAVLQRSLFSHLEHDSSKPTLYGFNRWVWALVLIRSVTGLVVAAVIKTTDNVVKGVASGVSVIVGCILSMFLFETPLTLQFAFGASLVIPASFFFSNEAALQRFNSKYYWYGAVAILLFLCPARYLQILMETTASNHHYHLSQRRPEFGNLRATIPP